MNARRSALAVCVAALAGVAQISAANASDLSEEYKQVRKLALKDAKVQAAFAKANAELDKRILEIDPSLRPFIEKKRGAKRPTTATKKTGKATTHTVAKGETLTSIARHYRISLDSLLRANHVSKQATLQVGQRLIIPSGS